MSNLPPAASSMADGPEFLAEIFERLRPALLAMIKARLGTNLAVRIDPEGVIHEAYLRALARWPRLDPKPASPEAWVRGQVRDRLIERQREALGRERDVRREVAGHELTMVLLAGSADRPSAALSRDERRAMIRSALDRLDAVDRQIVELSYFEGLSFAEIGPRVGLSQNAANHRAIRALLKLRAMIPPSFRPPGALLS